MSNSYKVQKKCWMNPLKIMILFAWSWSTNIIYLEVNNKIFVRPCWFLLYTFELPITESQTAVTVQDYTPVDDPYFIFTIIMLTKLYNCTWFNFILEFCSFMLHVILHIFSVFIVVVVVLLEKIRLINFYSQKWYTYGEITVKWKN